MTKIYIIKDAYQRTEEGNEFYYYGYESQKELQWNKKQMAKEFYFLEETENKVRELLETGESYHLQIETIYK